MEKYLINPNQKILKINKDILGHFSEHLGRCIYEGLYVGEDSPIPNVSVTVIRGNCLWEEKGK